MDEASSLTDDIEHQTEELMMEIQELKETQGTIMADLLSAQHENQILKEDIGKKTTSFNELVAKSNLFEKEIEELNREIDHLRQSRAHTESELKSARLRVESLKDEVKELISQPRLHDDYVSSMQAQTRKEFEAQLLEMSAVAKRDRTARAAAIAEREKFRAELRATQDEIELLDASKEALAAELEESQQIRSALEISLRQLRDGHKLLRAEKAALAEACETRIHACEEAFGRMSAQYEEATEAARRALQSSETAAAINEAVARRCDAFQQDLDSDRLEFGAAMESIKKAAEDEIRSLDAQLAAERGAASPRAAAAKPRARGAKKDAALERRAHDAEQAAAELRAANRQLRGEIEELTARLDEPAQRFAADISQLTADVGELGKSLRVKARSGEEPLRAELEQLQQDFVLAAAKANREVVALKNERAELRARNEKLQNDLAELGASNLRLRNQLATLKEAVASNETLTEGLIARFRDAETRLREHEAEAAAHTEFLERAVQDLGDNIFGNLLQLVKRQRLDAVNHGQATQQAERRLEEVARYHKDLKAKADRVFCDLRDSWIKDRHQLALSVQRGELRREAVLGDLSVNQTRLRQETEFAQAGAERAEVVLRHLREKLHCLQNEHGQEMTQLAAGAAQLRARVRRNEEEKAELRAGLKQTVARYDRAAHEVSELQSQVAMLKGEAAAAVKATQNAQALVKALRKALKGEKAEFKKALGAASKEKRRLLREVQQSINSYTGTSSRTVANAEQQIEVIRRRAAEELRREREQHAAAQAELREVARLREEELRRELEAAAAQYEEKIRALSSEKDELERCAAGGRYMVGGVASGGAAFQEAEEQHALRKENAFLKERTANLAQELGSVRVSLDTAVSTLHSLQVSAEAVEKALAAAEQQTADYRRQLDDERGEWEAAMRRFVEQRGVIQKAQAETSARARRVESKYVAVASERDSFAEQVRALRKSNEAYKKRVRDLISEKTQMQHRLDELAHEPSRSFSQNSTDTVLQELERRLPHIPSRSSVSIPASRRQTITRDFSLDNLGKRTGTV
eukprot:gnl/Chilomastix_cuspidata/6084.p1 GENE.gnl/Chilomastix_cuspidata/6084~~gnl/Chilomastix_cuspidata/6084.p1  ORF type:complete len:1047 (+),score=526.11 gnl/Chilomastix_cuspidata/6084:119-3259(+)